MTCFSNIDDSCMGHSDNSTCWCSTRAHWINYLNSGTNIGFVGSIQYNSHPSTLVIFSKYSPSSAGSHFQRTCGEKLKLLHFSKTWPLSVRCLLTIRARSSGRNFAKFDQRDQPLSKTPDCDVRMYIMADLFITFQ